MINILEFVACSVIFLWVIVPLIDLRIPPFPSYFFCRSVYATMSQDICCLSETNCSSSLNILIFENGVRLVSGAASAIFCTSVCLEAVQMVIYEIFLSLVFFNSCLRQIEHEILNTGLRQFNDIWSSYKQLQLLCQAFNRIYETGVFAVYVTANIIITILSASFSLKIYRESILLAILAFGVAIVCHLYLLVILRIASHAWTGSENIKASWKENPQLMRNLLNRRIRVSVRNMKVKIGSVNFVQRLTPFIVLSFCAEHIITVAIVWK
jgi:hypothetical protein